ncbi:MAG: histone deacetylase, partial [Spirochaetes bacterium]|nr:histone deacetylase [Spirochaetota bacterium]
AGFDTYENDPITNLLLEVDTYRQIGELLKGLNKPLFTVLEGGYDKDIPLCLWNYLEGLSQ